MENEYTRKVCPGATDNLNFFSNHFESVFMRVLILKTMVFLALIIFNFISNYLQIVLVVFLVSINKYN